MMASQVKAMSSANKAATAARKRLIEEHQNEYDEYLREERVAVGLPADPKHAALIARREKLEKQLAELNERLEG
jgi:hypothetical protein